MKVLKTGVLIASAERCKVSKRNSTWYVRVHVGMKTSMTESSEEKRDVT